MSNTKVFSWVNPTTNVDVTAPFVASEITGYTVGVRPNSVAAIAAGSVPGVYPTLVSGAAGPISVSALVPGLYAAAVRADGLVPSAWSAEALFTVVPPTPSAPTLFTVA
jgi:hypothetical protein